MALIKGSNSITDSTPETCLKKSYHIGKTEFTNICSDMPKYSKEYVSWGSLQWGGFILATIIMLAVAYKVLKGLFTHTS